MILRLAKRYWPLAALLSVWVGLAVPLGMRRWACLSWEERCATGLFQTLESAALLLWVRDRETLVSAILALSAAGVGVYFVSRQISQIERQISLTDKQLEQNDKLERRRRKQRFRAARAVFSLTLSAICDFSENAAQEWIRLRDQHRTARASRGGLNPQAEPADTNFPVLNPSTVNEMATMIEASNRPHGLLIADLLSQLQVRISRMRSVAAKIPAGDFGELTAPYVNSEIVEIAEVYARASALFAFARREGPAPTDDGPSGDEIRSALFVMKIRDGAEEDIYGVVARRYPDPTRD